MGEKAQGTEFTEKPIQVGYFCVRPTGDLFLLEGGRLRLDKV